MTLTVQMSDLGLEQAHACLCQSLKQGAPLAVIQTRPCS